ncbi:unnamed protein product [Gongylonema pulchrum]|uniref:Uncharacterized protein n=1 Tax=Gongylonema pulchrum TaxID=637853 RepID=A0A183CV25_9BILA|nr:unnamed protein product [Gongylonema pulchrum]
MLSGEQRQKKENLYEEAANESEIIWLMEKEKEEVENLKLIREYVELALKKLTCSNAAHNSYGHSKVLEAIPEQSMWVRQVKLPRLKLKSFGGDIE